VRVQEVRGGIFDDRKERGAGPAEVESARVGGGNLRKKHKPIIKEKVLPSREKSLRERKVGCTRAWNTSQKKAGEGCTVALK